MNQAEVYEWLAVLPYFPQNNKLRRCVNDVERVEVIEDLLRNANKDHMSQEDRTTCLETLEYLKVRQHGQSVEHGDESSLSLLQADDSD